MITYRVVKEVRRNEEWGAYTTYGVCGARLRDNAVTEFLYIADVFTDRRLADRFVAACNRGGLGIVHLPEAVEDALVQ